MNVADYLKELLLQYNEVSVPGLGVFSMVRKNAAYNEKEGKFYPPYHNVKFNPQVKNDEHFVQYLTEKKNILPATAVYLIEKFVSDLLLEAGMGIAEFTDMGWFSTENGQLVFKPNEKLIIDPSFYGYSAISLNKVVSEKIKPVYIAPLPVIQVQKVESSQVELVIPKPKVVKNRVNGWFAIFFILTFCSIVLLGGYWLFPGFAKKIKTVYHKIAGNNSDSSSDTDTKETVKHVKKELENINAIPIAIPKKKKPDDFEVIEYLAKTIPEARREQRRLENLGLNAEILDDVPGIYLNVSVGTFTNYPEANSYLQTLLKTGKISKKSHVITIIENSAK